MNYNCVQRSRTTRASLNIFIGGMLMIVHTKSPLTILAVIVSQIINLFSNSKIQIY